ncbi:MAG: molybdopterin biosynthesis protein [Planctomycetaceae bacterium]
MSETPSPDERPSPPSAARQTQFLDVISRDEAERRFHHHLTLEPLGSEPLTLPTALRRVLAEDVVSAVDVPSFDRSNVDGFAVQAADTIGADEESPRLLTLNDEVLSPGVRPQQTVRAGTATTIATGGMLPRGADAVLMVEHSDVAADGRTLEVRRIIAAGENVTFAGTDISCGETILRAGQLLTSRELGVLAAIGCDTVQVYRRPRVAILSTGDEIVSPGQPLPVGSVYDSNAAILGAAVEELGGEPIYLGVIPDDEQQLESAVRAALQHDIVLLSGGTSKGAGDLSYRIVSRLGKPGIVAHGVALKPGKPICMAVCDGKPVVILPGFPTSAIFTFHEFVAPVIRAYAGRPIERRNTVRATLPIRVNSQRGRTEYLLVSLFKGESGMAAYPMGKGSGSVTTFSLADGFITIDQQTEMLSEGSEVEVTLIDDAIKPADLYVVTSHCVGFDYLLSQVQSQGFTVKVMTIGSTGALAAAKRGECDIAGIHLLDAQSGEYNSPFITGNDAVELIPGYGRMQCLVFREGDERFAGKSVSQAIQSAMSDSECRMVNRNPGSGTRILTDQLLREAYGTERGVPSGYGVQVRSHNAVCAAVKDGRADWGVAIETVATTYGLSMISLQEERFDFVIPTARRERLAVRAFVELLEDAELRRQLEAMGFRR